jgi:hypothetical protein
VELTLLSLPRARFPVIAESAREVADVGLGDPDQWWRDTVDLIAFGLERMLDRSRARSEAGPGSDRSPGVTSGRPPP